MKATELRIGNYMGYAVQSDGVIISNKTNKPLKSRLNDKGYPCVSLSINGKTVFRRVHRIIAETFIPNPKNKPCVNHLDRNRKNFNVNNLEWCTHSENVIHSVNNGGRNGYCRNNTGQNNPRAKLDWITVCAIRDLYRSGNYSQNQLASIFNETQGRISKIINKIIWKIAR